MIKGLNTDNYAVAHPDMVVVIPCYNEENRLQSELYSQIAKDHPNITLCFINDGSTDATLRLLQDLSKEVANIEFLDVQPNKGKAEAVRCGFLYVAANIPTKCIAFYDADMATPFEDLVSMSELLLQKDYFMVTGCRFKRMGGNISRTYFRFLLGRMFATFAASVLRLPVYDTQCGAKVIKTSIVNNIFEEQFISKWLFDIELFARIIIHFGFTPATVKIIEYPLSSWTEVGNSKLKLKDILRQPYALLKINKHYNIKSHVKQTSH